MKADTACTGIGRRPSRTEATVTNFRCCSSQATGGVSGMVKSRLPSGSGISSTDSGSTVSGPLMPAMQRWGWSKMFPLASA